MTRLLMSLRHRLAGLLLTLNVSPNTLTVLGFALTCVAGGCLMVAAGDRPAWERADGDVRGSCWPLATAGVMLLAFLMDFLDGAVARQGGTTSAFGAILDSTLDRMSDLVLFYACGLHFFLRDNLTLLALSLSAGASAVAISYVKARTEKFADDCGVGFWQRGERCVTLWLGVLMGHVPASLWVLGTLPVLTLIRRLRYAALVTDSSRRPPKLELDAEPLFWRQPRGCWGYTLSAIVVALFVVSAPWITDLFDARFDPLGTLRRIVASAPSAGL